MLTNHSSVTHNKVADVTITERTSTLSTIPELQRASQPELSHAEYQIPLSSLSYGRVNRESMETKLLPEQPFSRWSTFIRSSSIQAMELNVLHMDLGLASSMVTVSLQDDRPN